MSFIQVKLCLIYLLINVVFVSLAVNREQRQKSMPRKMIYYLFHYKQYLPKKKMEIDKNLCGQQKPIIHIINNINCTYETQISWFAREVKGEDLRSSAHKCAWVRTPQPALWFHFFYYYFFKIQTKLQITHSKFDPITIQSFKF